MLTLLADTLILKMFITTVTKGYHLCLGWYKWNSTFMFLCLPVLFFSIISLIIILFFLFFWFIPNNCMLTTQTCRSMYIHSCTHIHAYSPGYTYICRHHSVGVHQLDKVRRIQRIVCPRICQLFHV